ncbi:MAG: hypothetical protein H8D45_23920, partial [Bacteroidetes bacterium]|nr:hypothetical protein [Bacteroidota bacterium]
PLDISGVKFNITLKNPMFYNSLEGDYVYNLQLPLTSKNKKNIKFSHRLETTQRPESQLFEGLFKGLKLFEGNLKYIGGKNSINSNINIGKDGFLNPSSKYYLDEVNYGKLTFIDQAAALTYFNDNVNKFYPDTDFALPYIRGITDSYLPAGTSGYHHKDDLNYWDQTLNTYVLDDSGDKGIIVPHLFLRFILDKLFLESGYSYDDKVFSVDNDFKKLILFNVYNANNGIPNIDGKPGYDSDITNLVYNNHVPRVLITDFITGLQNLLNVRFFFNHKNKHVSIISANDILDSTDYIDITSKIHSKYELNLNKKNGFIIRSTPDSADSYFALKVEIENNYLKMYGGAVENISDLPETYIGYLYYYVLSVDKFYGWSPSTEAWYQTTFNLITKFFVPPEDYKIESIISTLHGLELYPYNQHGNPAIDYRDITARIIFYLGLVDVAGEYFPYSFYESGNYSLLYPKSTGLYQMHWKKYIDFMLDPKAIKINVLLSASDISNFDISKKYRINGIDYLIKNIKIPVTEKAILPATMECYKV